MPQPLVAEILLNEDPLLAPSRPNAVIIASRNRDGWSSVRFGPVSIFRVPAICRRHRKSVSLLSSTASRLVRHEPSSRNTALIFRHVPVSGLTSMNGGGLCPPIDPASYRPLRAVPRRGKLADLCVHRRTVRVLAQQQPHWSARVVRIPRVNPLLFSYTPPGDETHSEHHCGRCQQICRWRQQ